MCIRDRQSIVATTEDEAVNAANKIGYPIVMKISSPQIVHKSDAGGVKLILQMTMKHVMVLEQSWKMQKNMIATRRSKEF